VNDLPADELTPADVAHFKQFVGGDWFDVRRHDGLA
jgi:hypothetical protein